MHFSSHPVKKPTKSRKQVTEAPIAEPQIEEPQIEEPPLANSAKIAQIVAFDKIGKTLKAKTLLETMDQISILIRDVFGSGKRMNYEHDQSLESTLIKFVQELATY